VRAGSVGGKVSYGLEKKSMLDIRALWGRKRAISQNLS